MDNQTINLTLVTVMISLGCGWICLYFSTSGLRRLSAWAESRASAIDYQKSVQAKMLLRLGVTADQTPALDHALDSTEGNKFSDYVGVGKQAG